MSRILRNSAICNSCNEELVSENVHDFKMCGCGELGVDGGNEYIRRVGNNAKDTSVIDDGDHEKRVSHLKWGRNYDKDMNRLPSTEWILIKDMETDHIKAILDGGWCNSDYYTEVFNDELKKREHVSS